MVKKINIGFLFTGYGSQYVGMGKDLYDQLRVVQDYIEQASSCLEKNFVKLLFASSDHEITKIYNAYLSLFLFHVSVVTALREQEIIPMCVGGFDIGEYSAAWAAGSMTFVDALYFINKYASAYEQFLVDKQFKQIEISNCPRDIVIEWCREVTIDSDFAVISIYQSPTDHIVSGTVPALIEFEKKAREASEILRKKRGRKIGIKDIGLGVGMHCFVMDEVVKSIKMYLEKIDIKSIHIPFISGLIGQTLQDGETVMAALMQHIHAPLHADDVINAFVDCDLIVQIGTSKSMHELLVNAVPQEKLYTVSDAASIAGLKKLIIERTL